MKNHFEFGVLPSIDSRNWETAYVRADTSNDAIVCMEKLTDDYEGQGRRFAAFVYRCFVWKQCLLNGVEIIEANQL